MTPPSLDGRNAGMTIAWISDFPVEWLPDAPPEIRALPKQHPMTWMSVLLQEFRNQPGLKLHVVTLRKGIAADVRFEVDNVTFHVLRTLGGTRAPSWFWIDTIRIQSVLRRVRPDLIHAWGSERGAALVASRLGLPYVFTIQGLMSWYATQVAPNWHERFAARTEKISLRRARVVTTESRFAVQFLKERYAHLRVEQIEHAPNPLFHRITRQPGPKLRFLTVATVDYRKGIDLLLLALGALCREQDFELVIVGQRNEELMATVRPQVPADLWQRITFRPGLAPVEVAKELATATMAVLPTRADTSPNAIKEAAVSGTPVVATTVGGIPDYITDNKNGVLCPPGRMEDLLQALRAACHHPLFGSGRVCPDKLQEVRQYLSADRMGQRFFEVYRSLCGQ